VAFQQCAEAKGRGKRKLSSWTCAGWLQREPAGSVHQIQFGDFSFAYLHAVELSRAHMPTCLQTVQRRCGRVATLQCLNRAHPVGMSPSCRAGSLCGENGQRELLSSSTPQRAQLSTTGEDRVVGGQLGEFLLVVAFGLNFGGVLALTLTLSVLKPNPSSLPDIACTPYRITNCGVS
jgi:hypothetical protein